MHRCLQRRFKVSVRGFIVAFERRNLPTILQLKQSSPRSWRMSCLRSSGFSRECSVGTLSPAILKGRPRWCGRGCPEWDDPGSFSLVLLLRWAPVMETAPSGCGGRGGRELVSSTNIYFVIGLAPSATLRSGLGGLSVCAVASSSLLRLATPWKGDRRSHERGY